MSSAVCAAFPSGDMIQPTPSQPAEPQPVYRWLLWCGVVVLAFVQAFVTFRGLDSAAGMEQAQAAREVARGQWTSSQVVKPMLLQQIADQPTPLSAAVSRDASQPVLPILLMAPLMKLTEPWWSFDTSRRVYIMDRVVACMGVFWFVMALLLIHGIARRLFDVVLAHFTVLILALCLPLWQMSTGGSSRALLLFLTCAFLHQLIEVIRREQEDEVPGFLLPLGMLILALLMTLTHWAAPLLVAFLALGAWLFAPGGKRVALCVAGGLLLGVGIIAARNQYALGEPFGIYRALLLSAFSLDAAPHLLRDFSGAAPGFVVTQLLQRINGNLRDLFANCYTLLMGAIPALAGVLVLLHRFKNPMVAPVRNVVFTGGLGIVLGAMIFGGQSVGQEDDQVLCALVPILTVFGLAFLAVLWARLQSDRQTLWREHGIMLVALLVSGWPMASGLYYGTKVGLFLKDRQAQWPPYMPNRLALLNQMVGPQELLFADQPWAVAWYADRACIWLPKDRPQMEQIRRLATTEGKTVAGLIISPLSSAEDRLHTQMSGPFGEWAEIIFRGPVLGFGLDLGELLKDRLPFRAAFPLTFTARPDGRLVPALIFYADSVRWDQLK
jgi:hypothetical protein